MVSPQLLVVMPAYNEQTAIIGVVRSWFDAVADQVPDFRLLVINDGSTDETGPRLDCLKSELGERLEVIHQSNRGHGQSCLAGYRIAIERSIPYILQVDSDGQSLPKHFLEFWRLRDSFDVIYGLRRRSDGVRRVLASWVLRRVLHLLAGVDCEDANVPYRLMKTAACKRSIQAIPEDFFLANVALAVHLRRTPGIRHGSVPIQFPPRNGGEPSVPFSKFTRKAIELFRQLRTLED